MYWSNIFFPRNSEKKTILADCGKLKFLLRDCFTSVNYLIGRIDENIPGQKLERIYVQTSASLGDNCKIIIKRLNQIEKLLEWKEFDLEKRLDTRLFEELEDLSTKFGETIKNSNYKNQLIGVIGFAVGLALWMTMVKKGYKLEDVISNLGMIETLVIVLIMAAILGFGINMVISAIYGALERDKLDYALEEYARAVEDFKPVVSTFCRNIYKVTQMIQVRNKK